MMDLSRRLGIEAKPRRTEVSFSHRGGGPLAQAASDVAAATSLSMPHRPRAHDAPSERFKRIIARTELLPLAAHRVHFAGIGGASVGTEIVTSLGRPAEACA